MRALNTKGKDETGHCAKGPSTVPTGRISGQESDTDETSKDEGSR
jgi:hypothetical protein